MTIYIRDVEQGTDDWHALRAGVVTASRLKDVIANGRSGAASKTMQAYAYQIANECLTGRSADDLPANHWMERGIEREAQARAAYEFMHDAKVEQVTFAFLDEAPRRKVGASPDGLVGDDGLLEIKCPRVAVHTGYVLAGKCPPEYRAQVQGQLWVTGRDWCDFVSYCPESAVELWRHRVERDDEYIEMLTEKVGEFWTFVDSIIGKLEKAA